MVGRLIGWILRTVWGLAVFLVILIIPWAVRILRVATMLVITSVASIFVGPEVAVERMSDDWTGRVMSNGIPVEYEDGVHSCAECAAILTIIAGFGVMGLVTVGLLVWIF